MPTPGDRAVEQGEAKPPSWLEQQYQNRHKELVRKHYKKLGPDMAKMTRGAKTPEEYKQKLEIFEHAKQLAEAEADRLASDEAHDSISKGPTRRGVVKKLAADYTKPKIDNSAGQKPLFGGSDAATKPVIPMPPKVTGVQTPGPRTAESGSKMATDMSEERKSRRRRYAAAGATLGAMGAILAGRKMDASTLPEFALLGTAIPAAGSMGGLAAENLVHMYEDTSTGSEAEKTQKAIRQLRKSSGSMSTATAMAKAIRNM